MKFKQNSKLIASCGPDVKIHEWPNGKTLFKVSPPNGTNNYFKTISWSLSAKQLLAVPNGFQPIVIRTVGDVRDFTADILEDAQISEAGIFSKNVEELITLGTGNGEIFVFDVFRNVLCKKYPTLPSPISFLDYTPKDTYLAAGCRNGQIYLYDATGEVCSSFVVPYSHSLSAMIFHPSRESYLAAASREGVVVIWDIRSNVEKFSAQNNTKAITDVAISSTEELLATVGLDRKVRIYDLRTKDLIFNKTFSSELLAVSFSQTGDEFAVGTSFGRVFFIDRRKPDYTKGSISAQKTDIRSLCFCNALTDEDHLKLQDITSEEILNDIGDSTESSNIDTDAKTQASGDFIQPEERLSRIPGGMDDRQTLDHDNNNIDKWMEQIPENVGDKQMPCLEMIEEWKLNAIKQDIINVSKENLHKFMEDINSHFLKIRMAVSREFCRIEQHNNRRWQDFNVSLLKLAGCEEPRKESENILLSDTLTEGTPETEISKPESLYSPAKTKVTNYTMHNENK